MSSKKRKLQKAQENTRTKKNLLAELRKSIDQCNPAKGELPKNIQHLSPSKDAGKIKYFNRISKGIKENFKTYQKMADDTLELEKVGPTGSGAETGKIWHSSIKKYIDNPSKNINEVGGSVILALKKYFRGIEFLQSEFPLYGYMIDEENSEIYFWNGNADAIGWYKDNYVIVEWKAVDLLEFWEKNRHAYGVYLHQCLVYARLLMLHLNLEKLPYILIVPINNKTGKEIRPGLFKDFPKECKDELNHYEWLKDLDENEPKLKILSLPSHLVNDGYNVDEGGFVDKQKTLGELFQKDCKIEELLDVLGFEKLKVVE